MLLLPTQAFDEGLFKPTRDPHQRDISHEEKKRNKSWPSIGFIVSWILCFVYIVAGAGFVMLYALSFGNDKTYQWYKLPSFNHLYSLM